MKTKPVKKTSSKIFRSPRLQRHRRTRLFKLAKFLATLKPEQLEMSAWRCGATACAVGWACSIPEFVRDGLYLSNDRSTIGVAVPVYGAVWGVGAAARFFGLSQVEAEGLFLPGGYDAELYSRKFRDGEVPVTPGDVVDVLESFLENCDRDLP